VETTTQNLPEKKTDVEIVQQLPGQSAFSAGGFEHAQRVASMLSKSNLIPEAYRGNIQNTMIALELANRIGASPLLVMQNLNVIQGKPSWSSSFIIASLNACKRFSPLRFEMSGEGEEYGCQAWAYDLATKDKLEGPKVTWVMAKAEGWLSKAGSKWKTMPELMFRYRAAAFFGRLYAPDILMGMQTVEEIQDVVAQVEEDPRLVEAINEMKELTTKESFEELKVKYSDLSDTKDFTKNLLYYIRKNIQ
jgi:hypothetical protein